MLNLISDIYYFVGFKRSNRLLVKTCSGYRPPSTYLKSRDGSLVKSGQVRCYCLGFDEGDTAS